MSYLQAVGNWLLQIIHCNFKENLSVRKYIAVEGLINSFTNNKYRESNRKQSTTLFCSPFFSLFLSFFLVSSYSVVKFGNKSKIYRFLRIYSLQSSVLFSSFRFLSFFILLLNDNIRLR